VHPAAQVVVQFHFWLNLHVLHKILHNETEIIYFIYTYIYGWIHAHIYKHTLREAAYISETSANTAHSTHSKDLSAGSTSTMNYHVSLKSAIYVYAYTQNTKLHVCICAYVHTDSRNYNWFVVDSNHLFWGMTQNFLFTESRDSLVELNRNYMLRTHLSMARWSRTKLNDEKLANTT
jgi:hypothetical protein